MRILFLSIIAILFTNSISALDVKKMQFLVSEWNDLHNNKNKSNLLDLYAEELYFYGKQKSKNEIYVQKKKFFNFSYSQEIISPVDFRYFNNDIVKASFTKKVAYKNKTNQYYAYLLIKKIDNSYKIIGESDTQTDERLAVSPNIGEEKRKVVWVPYIIAILIIFSGILFLFRHKLKSSKTSINNSAETIIKENDRINNKDVPKEYVISGFQKEKVEKIKETEEEIKGKDFEKFVVERFDKNYFTLIEWRGDKYHEGIYPKNNQLPDLEYLFKSSLATINFAVECKWRKAFYDDQVMWAKDYQLDNYKQYQFNNNCPVYVILGIGGNPSSPNDIYIIPLENISYTYLTRSFLHPYKKYGLGNFFLDLNTMSLT